MLNGRLQAQIEWALAYDGYRRLAASPEKLERLLRSARNSYRTHGVAPNWCGVDLLRGWAFYLVRADHFSGGGTLEDEWATVLQAVKNHPDAALADHPPDDVSGNTVARLATDLPTEFSSEPRQHKDLAFLAAKRERLWEAHVAPINLFVDQVRREIEAEQAAAASPGSEPAEVLVPYVDPDSGGTRAKVLLLLESPARPAALATGSGMLSADNNDGSAENVWLAYEASGLPRTYGLHWNAVPWFVGSSDRNAGVTNAQVERGRPYLLRLLNLAPDVRVLVALGKRARESAAGNHEQLTARGIRVLNSPHPSPRWRNRTQGASLIEINSHFAEALRIVLDAEV